MAGEDGRVQVEVAFRWRLLSSGKAAVKFHAVGNLERSLAVCPFGWEISAFSYPDLLATLSHLQGLLQIAQCIFPGLPVALAAAFDINDRLRLHGPCHSH